MEQFHLKNNQIKQPNHTASQLSDNPTTQQPNQWVGGLAKRLQSAAPALLGRGVLDPGAHLDLSWEGTPSLFPPTGPRDAADPIPRNPPNKFFDLFLSFFFDHRSVQLFRRFGDLWGTQKSSQIDLGRPKKVKIEDLFDAPVLVTVFYRFPS